ncbi:helix-turn-helix domain-containing protein [Streptomyces alfalfae]
MSHEAVTWAMDDAPMLRTEKGRPDTTARGVLQALAEYADKRGRNARPSLIKLRYRTGYDRRTVQRALRRLEDAELIRATGTYYDCTVYALALHRIRPATDWTDLQEEEEQQRQAAAQRQRKARAKRAVTHTEDVTVTDSDDVTEPDVTHSDAARHTSEVRDVTHSDDARHALSAAQPVLEPPREPSLSDDGRQAPTGSRDASPGGSAAPATAHPAEEDDVRAAAIGCVIALLPRRVRDQLPSPVPRAVQDAIRTELARGLSPDELTARAARRWMRHGYEADAESADGPGILRPVGVAVALVRRGDCRSPRCDDGRDLDTGDLCRTCEREAEDRMRLQEAAHKPVQGTILMPVPSGAPDPTPAPHKPARPPITLVFRECEGTCGRVRRTEPAPAPAGMCEPCRTAAEQAAGRAVTA